MNATRLILILLTLALATPALAADEAGPSGSGWADLAWVDTDGDGWGDSRSSFLIVCDEDGEGRGCNPSLPFPDQAWGRTPPTTATPARRAAQGASR